MCLTPYRSYAGINEVPSQMVCRSAMYLIASHFPLTEKSDKRTVSGFENG